MQNWKSILAGFFVLFAFLSCSSHSEANNTASNSTSKITSVAVFVPGTIQGSPIYEMMDKGVRQAVQEFPGVKVKTIEGGFDQSKWQSQIMGLAASGEFGLIVSSNPALPELCDSVSKAFPAQKFLILEAWSQGRPAIASLYYNHRELAWLHGYLAGLIAKEKNLAPRIALIAGQEYPEMNLAIRPGLEEGLRAVFPQGTVDFRVVGNWYDASKAEEQSKALASAGVSLFLPIAGGANQGVVTAAKKSHSFALWYDIDGYDIEKGLILGSGQIYQDKAAYELTKKALAGTLEYGKPLVVGVKEGYLGYLTHSETWKTLLSDKTRQNFEKVLKEFQDGTRAIEMPIPKTNS